ncbi:ABC transporter substrate-binding protein [Pectobacterium odoriferum]|uniref:ABC transporter substrate-binding protein n=1 Tax=Pectobacterium odoriferum TaxID=78398 RepID=A0ABD6VNE1_9GAMM|nr:ABC transporter substrate-binding protein [Pectobacterium odoriferum]KGA42973.1 ABC transporter substrate-binding protein [Pectobacterium odoriferum]MCA6961844.1 ABC transporter substrate-binding protein [Pectobacterium odoriferum]MCH5009948.1 ABC transporter substrate-binding protein [Pectobacterium odoriferum]POD94505.1 ABC transporter substrate-binding protein [Pectobacterium odoriferum]POE12153.1 ABC transporter substrate-binding protein [Pectobacterium odoriferum]
MNMRNLLWPVSGLLSATLLLSGCFNEPEENHTLHHDGRIKLAMLQPPRSGLTPLSDDAFKLSRWSTAETLVVLDKLGEAQPALATKWQQIDDKSWRFELRPNVHFHDKTTLNAATVVNALTVASTAAPKPRILDGVQLTVKADGDNAVIVSTATADPLLPQRLSSPQLTILSTAAYGKNGIVNPINTGSGPFVLRTVTGTSSAVLDRFDGYWGEKAQASGIDVSFVSDGAARAAALRTGTADIVEAVPVSQAPLLDQSLVHEVPMPRTNTLYLNTRHGVMQDPAMRAAVRDAINRQQLVDNVYEKRADIAQGLLGPALPWAAELRQPVANPVKAGTPAGATITLATFSDRAELPEVAVYLAQQLTAAGFTVKQVVREYAQIESDALAGKFDAFILSRATVLDSGDPVAYLYSDFACEGSFNIAQLCRPEIDQALQKAAAIPAGVARRQAIMQAESLILASDAAIPMLHERVIQGESAQVKDALRDPRERTLINVATHIVTGAK